MDSWNLRRSGGRRPSRFHLASFGVVAICLLFAGRVAAQTTYGTLSNFDVFNDTGQECHGFEIELDGLSSADVTFTFGSPYQRYGNPLVVDFPGGVYVRYESPYDAGGQMFTATTPMAPSVITPTNGHACWTGGSGNYLTSGCEHFGVGLIGNPTNTVYRWLIADPLTPGALQPSGTKVSIPAPSWNVAPAAPGVPPVVRAAIPAEPPEVEQQFGDAMWVKVFVTESENDAELHHLVTDDPAVPQEQGETEIEWVILQAGPGAENELANEAQAGANAASVTRRYEFYEYTGAYNAEDHEVLCGGDGSCDVPLEGELGNYIGAQMAALNLAPIELPTPTETEVIPTETVSPTEVATATEAATETPTETPAETPTGQPATETPTETPLETPTFQPATATETAVPVATATEPPPTGIPTTSSTPTATAVPSTPTSSATIPPPPTASATSQPQPSSTWTATPVEVETPTAPAATETAAPASTATAIGIPTRSSTPTAVPSAQPSATAVVLSNEGCAMSPSADGSGGWLALAGLALITIRRRRRRG